MQLRKPKIPSLSAKTAPDIRRAINSLVEYMSGVVGYQSQVEAMVRDLSGKVDDIGSFPEQPAPTGLVVRGGFNVIMLQWDQSTTSGFSHTEVWRSEEDNLATAAQVGTTAANLYSDTPPDSSLSMTYYYWIRYVNQAGNPGPYNDTAGTPGSTADDPEYVLEVLEGRLSRSHLHETLGSDLDSFDRNITLLGDDIVGLTDTLEENTRVISVVETDVGEIIETTGTLTTDLGELKVYTEQIKTDLGDVGKRVTTVETDKVDKLEVTNFLEDDYGIIETTFSAINDEVEGLLKEYTLRIDNQGYISGYGMASTDSYATFEIRADEFAIAPTSTTPAEGRPFFFLTSPTTIDGEVFEPGLHVNRASIANLTATNFVGGTITADNVNASARITSPVVYGADIWGSRAWIGGYSINEDEDGNYVSTTASYPAVYIDSSQPAIYAYDEHGGLKFDLRPGDDFLTIGGGCDYGGLTYQDGTLCLPHAVVGTLQIAGSAVTVPVHTSGTVEARTFNSTFYTIMNTAFAVDGLSTGETAKVLATATLNIRPASTTTRNIGAIIYINGNAGREYTYTVSSFGIAIAATASLDVGNDSNIPIEVKVRAYDGDKDMAVSGDVIVTTSKR